MNNDYLLVKKYNMINLVDAICATKAAMVSLMTVLSGSLLNFVPDRFYNNVYVMLNGTSWYIPESFGMALQWFAWTIAIFAGIVSIVNGTKNWFKCEDEKVIIEPEKPKHHIHSDQIDNELNEPKQPE